MDESDHSALVTLKDVAQVARVSAMTVSLALRNSPKVSPATRARIQTLAKKMRYQPNAFAVSLRATQNASIQAHQATLALIVGHRDANPINSRRPHYQHMLEGVQKRAQTQGYAVEVIWRYASELTPRRIASLLRARNIPGIIFCSIHEHELGFPIGAFACSYLAPTTSRLPHVSFDPYQSMVDLMQRIYKYPGIGLAVWPAYDHNNRGRTVAAFKHMHRELGLEETIPVCFHQPNQQGHSGEIRSVIRWIRKYKVKTLISPSAHLEQWLRESDIDIPGELLFINLELQNFDNTTPGMLPPWRLIGAAATDLVIAQIHRGEHGYQGNPKSILLRSEWHAPSHFTLATGKN